MTWDAQRGKVVLVGPERQLFRSAIHIILEDIEKAQSDDESRLYYGARLFNSMSRTQQAASLEQVVGALFHSTDECYPVTAWSESTLASILGMIKELLVIEIDDGEPNEVRNLLNSVIEGRVEPTSDKWSSQEEWSNVFECYEEQFMWDLDYEDVDLLDAPPEVSQAVGDMLGVSQEYRTAIPPDLKSEDELEKCLNRISALVR